MVSRKQSVLTASLLLGAAYAAGAGDNKAGDKKASNKKDAGVSRPASAGRASSNAVVVSRGKFRSDDPLWVEPKPLAVRNVKTIEIGDLYDFVAQSFVTPRQLKHEKRTPAQNVNTVGEVPDSQWYANRHGLHTMTLDELRRGAGSANPPDPDRPWKVISAKSDGVMPGFHIEDSHGNRYLLKLDPADYPELSSAADVIGSKIYYALGYNTPENYVVYFRRDQLTVSEESLWRDRMGKEHMLSVKQIDEWLADQPRDSKGRYRAMASRWIDGKPIGPFNMDGTRSDDPNDVVPHENRRELRGMRVFAAWLNDTDAKSINTLDSLVTKNGVPFIEHFRIDWGASLGSDSLRPKDIRRGHDYIISPKTNALQAASFGFYLPKWMRTHYPKIRGTGTFDYESFDPVNWHSNYPVTPFMLMDEDDAFWAAKKVMAFSNDELRAFVETGGYTDTRAVDWVTTASSSGATRSARSGLRRAWRSTTSAWKMAHSRSTIWPRSTTCASRSPIAFNGPRSTTRAARRPRLTGMTGTCRTWARPADIWQRRSAPPAVRRLLRWVT
ncbi:MAG TPA: hypothetical protein VHW24_22485 [Bryobacteraceae bacterium]|nr:hypothetical protein [Bryobacteraceae bacterium]